MPGIWHDEGEQLNLNVFFKGATRPANSWYLGLYTNNTALGESATLTNVTEPSTGGYSRQLINDADWTLQGSSISAPQKTFAPTGSSWTVYGWFLCTVATGTEGQLLASEHFSDGPYNVSDGGSVKVTITISQD